MTIIDNTQINLIKTNIDVNDRGLAYGDGLFETIACVNGELHNWHLHWKRLILGAERLSLMIPDENFLLDSINSKLFQNNDLNTQNHSINKVIKVIITRGKGGRGYQFPQQPRSTLIISIHNWPEKPVDDYQNGIKLKVCQTCLAPQPALAGIKHLNRLEQVLARNELNGSDYQDGIMQVCPETSVSSSDSKIIEATSSNIFFVKNNQLFTPKIDTCGVQGTIRQEIISLTRKMAIKLEQGYYVLDDLSDASEVFLTNSIFGVVPVLSITDSDNIQRFSAQQNPAKISAKLSNIINKALNRPELMSDIILR
ncbi:MAG: aminodeoxychorismate lyase [gamma proteobacterium symbiont of Bathyaustriella thionipta]|nr:aminodeoxychorismate lyase [gamma proteobacterium symbiont of Bathyaustriella thionipta]MCU7949120.1 aminodeoxychorismate lyase [gamma proteobacterium symbiont of Bathyaustriella thionipta]MCU7954431.1 aminodeoxychorismate lyase [gamma proteobacterium symbiont of Bathyaustriella thionipta]MCU7955707.1 aminodeoxychorismate lyase [gamma proteobacterium symbiont of Bathyaustriella thionipta]MCU7966199.1 aminodeoxychorismate lyase [gamma proteobacterium symbiont of Bathyaustriella thionipta]